MCFSIPKTVRYIGLSFLPLVSVILIMMLELNGVSALGTPMERFVTPVVVSWSTILLGGVFLAGREKFFAVMGILFCMDIALFLLSNRTLSDFLSRIIVEWIMQIIDYGIIISGVFFLGKIHCRSKRMQPGRLSELIIQERQQRISLALFCMVTIWTAIYSI